MNTTGAMDIPYQLYQPKPTETMALLQMNVSAQNQMSYARAFAMFDKDKTGVLSSKNIIEFYRKAFDIDFSEEDGSIMIEEFMGSNILGKTSTIDFTAFVRNLEERKKQPEAAAYVSETFNLMCCSKTDADPSRLNAVDLKHGLNRIGEEITIEEARDMLQFSSEMKLAYIPKEKDLVSANEEDIKNSSNPIVKRPKSPFLTSIENNKVQGKSKMGDKNSDNNPEALSNSQLLLASIEESTTAQGMGSSRPNKTVHIEAPPVDKQRPPNPFLASIKSRRVLD